MTPPGRVQRRLRRLQRRSRRHGKTRARALSGWTACVASCPRSRPPQRRRRAPSRSPPSAACPPPSAAARFLRLAACRACWTARLASRDRVAAGDGGAGVSCGAVTPRERTAWAATAPSAAALDGRTVTDARRRFPRGILTLPLETLVDVLAPIPGKCQARKCATSLCVRACDAAAPNPRNDDLPVHRTFPIQIVPLLVLNRQGGNTATSRLLAATR